MSGPRHPASSSMSRSGDMRLKRLQASKLTCLAAMDSFGPFYARDNYPECMHSILVVVFRLISSMFMQFMYNLHDVAYVSYISSYANDDIYFVTFVFFVVIPQGILDLY